ECAARSVLERAHHPDVVLVGDLAGGVTRLAAVIVRATACRQRSLPDEGLAGGNNFADPSDEVMAEVDRVAEDVGADAVTCLVDEESPRQQAHGIAAVHREETAVVVGDLAY